MHSKVIVSLFTLAFVCPLTALGSPQSGTLKSLTPIAATVSSSLRLSTGATVSPAFDHYAEEITNDLYQERFDLLESLAQQARTSKERFPGGYWKLNALYTGLNTPPAGDHASESEWQIHLSKLRKWVSQSPHSITAYVGLGGALVEYAWNARGQGYASTVTPTGARLFNERLEMAEKVLNDAQQLNEKCPHWYVAMLQIGLSEGWEPSRFNKLFNEAIAFEPNYYYYYRVRAMYLLPRWYGEPGEWERFAEESSERVGGRQGAMLYYLIASHIHSYYGRSFFVENRVSWSKMKEGFESLEEAYGKDASKLNEICSLARLAGDSGYARCVGW